MELPKLSPQRRQHIIVGMTAIGGIVGLVLLLTAFGYLPTLLQTGYEVKLYTDDVAGLRENSRVQLWGRNVGEVSEVGFSEPGAPAKAYVVMRIKREFDVPEDVDIRIEKPIFGGGPVIVLTGSSLKANMLAKDGSAQLDSPMVFSPMAKLDGINENLQGLNQNVGKVVDNVDRVAKHVDSLFGDGSAGSASLPSVVAGLDQRLAELKTVLDGAGKWLNDDKLRGDVTQAAANAKKLTETLDAAVKNLETRYAKLAESAEAGLKKMGGTAEQATKSIAAIEKRYVALADDAAKVVSKIDTLVAKAGKKDSTIGLLLNDAQLYNNLVDTSKRIKKMTDEARLLIKKWNAEGVRLRVFD